MDLESSIVMPVILLILAFLSIYIYPEIENGSVHL